MLFYTIAKLLVIILVVIISYYLYDLYKKYHKIYKKTTIKNKFSNDLGNPDIKNFNDTYEYVYSYSDYDFFNQRLLQHRDVLRNNGGQINPQLEFNYLLPQNNTRDVFLPNVIVNDINNFNLTEFEDEIIDNQTVHDSYVQKATKNMYNQEKKIRNLNQTNDLDVKAEISEFIQKHNLGHKDNVNSIIDKIKSRNSFITNFDDYEYNILCKTWHNNIQNHNIKAEIVNQLLDCTEKNGSLYCPTGVATRILESLYIENPEKYPKTKEIINQEMLNIASKYKQENENLDDKEFKTKLIEHYTQLYDGLMTSEEIKDNIKDWIDYI